MSYSVVSPRPSYKTRSLSTSKRKSHSVSGSWLVSEKVGYMVGQLFTPQRASKKKQAVPFELASRYYFSVSLGQVHDCSYFLLKLINNSSSQNKENHNHEGG